ncbi:MAG: nucleotidyltransferase domain-containing protein [Leptolyngbyaceae cyanobacterium SM2_5_2]|nr:nucleotidyltransferase domain-containing protein [Leptolyngbyaceae cyanobacterium SM2_5_2]
MVVDPKYIDYWRQVRAEQQIAQQQAKKLAWQEVNAIASVLRQQFGATRVMVFGSLLSDRFQDDSDLDIAAAPIPKARFFEAVAAVNECSQRWVDLKPLDDLDPYFKQRVLDTGLDIHGPD